MNGRCEGSGEEEEWDGSEKVQRKWQNKQRCHTKNQLFITVSYIGMIQCALENSVKCRGIVDRKFLRMHVMSLERSTDGVRRTVISNKLAYVEHKHLRCLSENSNNSLHNTCKRVQF